MLLLIMLVVLAAVGALLFVLLREKTDQTTAVTAPILMQNKVVQPVELPSDSGCDLTVFNESGIKILESREIHAIPQNAQLIPSSSSAINRATHIAADLFKGAASIPNKTVEIIFKPEIRQGLADGTYTLMRTKAGEDLATAVDLRGKFVGNGRVIQGGKVKQLASGAFQLVSVAVAQSHLADIDRSLNSIKDSISEVLERLENEDRARITGAFDYLCEILAQMKGLHCPDELSQQKRNAIEMIVKDSNSWRNKLEEDMSSLIRQISILTDLDTFGTGDTFERLKSFIERVRPLLKRRELFLNLASAINFATTYLDPTQHEYSKISVKESKWEDLIKQFKDAVMERESALMGRAFWNSNETLQLRKDKLRASSLDCYRTGHDQEAAYLELHSSLTESMSRLIDTNGNVRMAIAFDAEGAVGNVAIL